MTGRAYRLGGVRVTVLAAFTLPSKRNPLPDCPPWLVWHRPPKGAPRNVVIRYESGPRVGRMAVRPFRGLCRVPEVTTS